MAVERIRLLTILGPYESLDRVIRVCAQSGCFQPENASGFIGDSEGYSYLSEENPRSMQRIVTPSSSTRRTGRSTSFTRR